MNPIRGIESASDAFVWREHVLYGIPSGELKDHTWRQKVVGIALEAKSNGYEGLLLVRLQIGG